jgi:hypothetical protein
MSRTCGTMKVAVFDRSIELDHDKDSMLAVASLLGEASNWIRDESVRDVQTIAGKKGVHRLYNIMLNLDHQQDSDESGVTISLFLHYDDNEKEK